MNHVPEVGFSAVSKEFGKTPAKRRGLKNRGPLSQGGTTRSRKSLGHRRGCHDDRDLFERVWLDLPPLELTEGKLAEQSGVRCAGGSGDGQMHSF